MNVVFPFHSHIFNTIYHNSTVCPFWRKLQIRAKYIWYATTSHNRWQNITTVRVSIPPENWHIQYSHLDLIICLPRKIIIFKLFNLKPYFLINELNGLMDWKPNINFINFSFTVVSYTIFIFAYIWVYGICYAQSWIRI